MIYIKMPCKDCKNRSLGCHDNCEEYLKAKKLQEQIKEKERELANNRY